MNTWRRRGRPAMMVLALTIMLGGCVSTKERYEKGMELEAEGEYARAAAHYIRVLREKPGWEDTRADLREAGAQAVDRALDAANAAEATGDFVRAAEELAALDALRRDAAEVGVELAVPDDYEAYRQEMTEEAVASLVERGEQAETAGRWADALRAYERAQQQYPHPPERAHALTEARARVLLRWGEDDLLHDRYRAAYDRAEQAARLIGPDARLALAARSLQEKALAVGSRSVVLLPAGSLEAVERTLPRGLLRRLDEVLQYEHWSHPPLFVAPVDPAALHRELRRYRYDRDRLTERQASEVGRALDAHDVVLVDLTAFTWTERDVRSERRAVRTRGRAPVDTAFVLERYRVEVRGEAAYAVVDPVTRAVVDRGTVRADASDRFERGRYEGDPRDLDLSRRDRGYFDRDALDADEAELEDAFVDQLAERLAQRVYESLSRRVR